eukprot:jgi/Chrzof1/7942/UNPLg00002.t1
MHGLGKFVPKLFPLGFTYKPRQNGSHLKCPPCSQLDKPNHMPQPSQCPPDHLSIYSTVSYIQHQTDHLSNSTWHSIHPGPKYELSELSELSAFRIQGSGFRVQGSGFRVQGSGFRV